MTKLSFYSDVCKKMDDLIFNAELENGSIEGLNSSIVGRLFVSVVDTFGGLLSTFGSNLTNINKALKRSELNEFVSSNMLRTRTVDKIPYEKLIDVKIDCPANLNGTYKNAVDSLVKVYMRLNAVSNGKMVDTSFREMLNSLNSGDVKVSKQADAIARVMTGLVQTAKPAVDEVMSQFSGKFSAKIPFDKAFLTMDEFVGVRRTLLENEFRLQDIKPMTDTVASIAATLKSITAAVEVDKLEINGRDLNNMASVAKSIALIFDAYGMASQRQMALEHNYVLCVNYLYANVK